MKTPQVLLDIKEAIQTARIKIAEKIEGEGRTASHIDEGTIIHFLESHPILSKHIIKVKSRYFCDFIALDYDGITLHPVNIKTSEGKSSTNCTSKGGFVFSLTDMSVEEIPSRLNWKQFVNLINARKSDIPNKDYWFLCVDKKDSSNVMMRGAKQIAHYVENSNPANNLQINLKKERVAQPVERSYEEAYDTIVGGIYRCHMKAFTNLHEEWKKNIVVEFFS